MAVDTKAVAHSVVDQLSLLITHAMASRTYHAWNPSHSVDEDEAKIKRYANRVDRLRGLRLEFENLMFGEIDE